MTLLHDGYLIVASGQRIETTGKWEVWVGVFWNSQGRRQTKVLNTKADTFDSKDEAEMYGLQIAKDWALKHTPSPS